jgi:adenylate kinase family enzyme
MKRFYITGVSGVGKSSVAEKLAEKGIPSIDIDSIRGLCHWVNNDTQKIVEWRPGMSNAWYKKHQYICDKKKLINLMNSYKDIVAIAGLAYNRSELWNLFDKVFLLRCEKETFIKRITERENHDFGKHALEKENILSWYKNFEKKIVDEGAIPIDANEPLDAVVNKIIKHIKGSASLR